MGWAGQILVANVEKAELLNEAFVENCTTDNGDLPSLRVESKATTYCWIKFVLIFQ